MIGHMHDQLDVAKTCGSWNKKKISADKSGYLGKATTKILRFVWDSFFVNMLCPGILFFLSTKEGTRRYPQSKDRENDWSSLSRVQTFKSVIQWTSRGRCSTVARSEVRILVQLQVSEVLSESRFQTLGRSN